MSTRMVAIGDVELCVEEFGDVADPTILLIAGAASAMEWWDADLCGVIASGGRRVVRYDHRDTGRSTTGPVGSPDYDGNTLDRDCVGLVETLGSQVHLVGLSSGGGIAQGVALRRPELVASLTLIATASVGGVDWSTVPGPVAELAARLEDTPPEPDWSDREAVIDSMIDDQRAHAGTIAVDEERVRTLAGQVYDRSIDVAAAANHWIAIVREGEAGADEPPLDIHDLVVPTLVVHGNHDPLFPLPHGQALAEAIPDARLLVIDGMGHEYPPPSTWEVLVPALLEHTGHSRSNGSA